MEGKVGKESLQEVFDELFRQGVSFPIDRPALMDLVRGKRVQWRWNEWIPLDEFLGIVAPPRLWSVAQIEQAFDDWFKNPIQKPIFMAQYRKGALS